MYNVFTTEEIRKLIEDGHGDRIPADVMRDYRENMEARPNYVAKGVNNLYKAICYEAVVNYKTNKKYIAEHKGSRNEKICKNVERAERENAQIAKFIESDFFRNNSKCAEPRRVFEAIDTNMNI